MCRQLAHDENNLMLMQSDHLRLSAKLIYAFRWLENCFNDDSDKKNAMKLGAQGANEDPSKTAQKTQEDRQQDLIFREIAKTFEYVLKYQELHQRLIKEFQERHERKIIHNANIKIDAIGITEVSLQLVRRTSENETILRHPDDEKDTVNGLIAQSKTLGTSLDIEQDHLIMYRRE